jgi:glycosyltransferase involved in cell wall biosynthesis
MTVSTSGVRATSKPHSLASVACVDLVLPCLDEEQGLAWLLPRLTPDVRAVVVDNGSRDASVAIALEHGATVVHAAVRGFGSACWSGLQACTAPVVAFMDADASMDPAQLGRVTAPVLAGEADLVLGARRPAPGSWPIHARLANRVLAREMRRRTGLPLTDLGPMRATRREDLLALDLHDRRSGWPLEMVLAAHARGWRVRQVSVDYFPRAGRSKVTGTVRGTLHAVRDMSAQLARHS